MRIDVLSMIRLLGTVLTVRKAITCGMTISTLHLVGRTLQVVKWSQIRDSARNAVTI